MPESDHDRQRMLERHKLVVALIEINSEQLRCESAAAGLDIEEQHAFNEERRNGKSATSAAILAALARRRSEIAERWRKLAIEREWLELSLAEFDAFEPRETKSTNIKGQG